ncbi:MAG: V-type ATP synthase subunit I [Phycisphaerae bacterium]|nr:V-type ATP synthase subunit I [Phycisphaerae bacterium]
MAICRMTKVMIVSHRNEAAALLAALQQEGIVEILDAARARITKEWPQLRVESRRPKDLEEQVARLEKAIGFLQERSESKTSVLRPRVEVDRKRFAQIATDSAALELLDQTERIAGELDQLDTEIENVRGRLEWLRPWQSLEIAVEQMRTLHHAICLTGLLADQHWSSVTDSLKELGGVIESVGRDGIHHACVIVCLKERQGEAQKILRAADFDPVGFEGMSGTPAEMIETSRQRLDQLEQTRQDADRRAKELADDLLSLRILYDYDRNRLGREKVRTSSPATEQVVLLEGWVKEKDFARLETIVKSSKASSVERMEVTADEETPVEIDNPVSVRPFESITRLYGLPIPSSVDPTPFLAPFFAIFFGLCLADAGYGLILVALLAWFIRKVQGDKKILWMLLICGITTFLAGVLTGSWFGDAIASLIPQQTAVYRVLSGIRDKSMLFDPMTQPMTFFLLSLALGYLQIQFGLFIALIHNLRRKDFSAAVFDQLSWILMLNLLLGLGLSKAGQFPKEWSSAFGIGLIVPAAMILFFSGRGLPWGGRIGIGSFQLFSTVFYGGDILSYVRLMALGMVGSGFGMAINVLVKLVMDVPYVGWLLGAVVFVGGHLFNLALSLLGAFVHSLRLQFVEFFPKFFTGGGRPFEPLRQEYEHVWITTQSDW